MTACTIQVRSPNLLEWVAHVVSTQTEKENVMKAISASLLSLALIGATVPAWAASETDCKANWEKADANKDGTLEGTEATAYLEAIKGKEKTYSIKSEGKLTSVEFTDACKADAFKDVN
jgi:hypothetical protein